MSTPINTLPLAPSGTSGLSSKTGTGDSPVSTGGESFGSTLKDLLGKVDESSNVANDKVAAMINGTGDVHEAMIALQNADTMLQMTVQIRNKLVQAYQDVMRMPV